MSDVFYSAFFPDETSFGVKGTTMPAVSGDTVVDIVKETPLGEGNLSSEFSFISNVSALPTTKLFEGRMVYYQGKLWTYKDGAWVPTIASEQEANDSGIINVDTLPTVAEKGNVVFLNTDSKLYRFDGQQWTSAVASTDVTGFLASSNFPTNLRPVENVSTLPNSNLFPGRVVYLATDNKLYRYNGSSWVSSVSATDISGQIAESQITNGAISAPKFASDVKPVEIVSSLPTTANVAGRTVFLTTDQKLYRYTGSAWTKEVDGADLKANSITAGAISAGAIKSAQIEAGAITVDKLAVTSTENLIPNGSFDADIHDTAPKGYSRFQRGGSGDIIVINSNDAAWPYSKMMRLRREVASSDELSVQAGNIDWDDPAFFSKAGIPCEPGDEFYFECWTHSNAVNTSRIDFVGKAITGGFYATSTWTATSLNADTSGDNGSFYANKTGWRKIQGTVKWNENFRVKMAPRFWNINSGAGTDTYFGAIVLRRRNTGMLLVDGSISADKVAANAITTDKLAANSVNASKILAGSVSAAAIAANAVTAKHLFIGDTSNIVDNGWSQGTLDGWQLEGVQAYYLSSTEGDASGWVYQSNARDQAYSQIFAVTPGEVYYMEAWVYNTHASNAVLWAIGYSTTGATVSHSHHVFASRSEKNTWVKISAQYTIPSGVRGLKMLLNVDKPGGSTGASTYWSKPVCRRAGTGELIVDGAISTNKLSANAVTADKVQAEAISADKIAANAVTTDKLAANSVTANKILAGSVSAAAIAANAVTADHIQAGAVSAAAIAAQAITVDKLAVTSTENLIANGSFEADVHATAPKGYTRFSVGSWGNILTIQSYDPNWPHSKMMRLRREVAGSDELSVQAGNIVWDDFDFYSKGGIICEPGDEFYFECWTHSNAVNTSRIDFVGKAITGGFYATSTWTATSLNADTSGDNGSFYANKTGWRKIQGTVKWNENFRVKMAPRFWNINSGAGTDTYFGAIVLRRRNTGMLLVDGSISADKVAANAITTDKLAANSVNASKILAGSVSAAAIAANAVTAKHLFIGDTSNIVDNGWSQGTLDGWQIDGLQNFYVNGGGSWAGWCLQSNARDQAYSDIFAVTPGEVYYMEAWVYNTHSAIAVLYAIGSDNTSSVANKFEVVTTTAVKNNWVKIAGQYTIPAGVGALKMLLMTDRVAGSGGASTYWTKPICRRAGTGDLIVDGAISTNKLSANAVTADKIQAGAITAAKIGAGEITTSKLKVLPVNMNPDPHFQDWDYWLNDGNWYYENNTGSNFGNSMGAARYITLWDGNSPGTARRHVYTPWIPGIIGGRSYSIRANCINSSNQDIYAVLDFFRSRTNSIVGNVFIRWSPGTSGFLETSGIAPADADYYRIIFHNGGNTGYSGIASIANMQVSETASGSMIVNGAITADKLAANSVDANKIQAGAITAGKIEVTELSAITSNLGYITGGSININNRFIVNSDGSMLIRSATGGQRTELDLNGGRVYDGNGTLRVRWGIW